MSIDNIIQLLIILSGGMAIIFSQQVQYPILNKYAPIIGMVGQPFWLYTSYINHQWGIFILSIVYAYAWWVGIKNQWLNK